MKSVFPFATGSAVTASYSDSASVSLGAGQTISASIADTAGVIINSVGPRGRYICTVTYDEYQLLLAGTHYEDCVPE